MTKRATGTRLTDSAIRIPMLIAALGMAACEALPGEPKVPGDDDDSAGETPVTPVEAVTPAVTPPPVAAAPTPVDPPAPDNKIKPCAQSTEKAKEALTTYCASCHGPDSTGMGGFKAVLDAAAMVSGGKVIKDDPANSPLYKRMANNTMPPTTVAKRPAAADIDAVKEWIECGAPPLEGGADPEALEFTVIDDRLDVVLDDLRAMPNPNDRLDTRYLDLSNLANAGYTKEQIDVYREATIFLVNSLSKGQRVVAPEAIDDQELILRLNLDDYEWDADTWTLFEEIYPYAVVYDQNSRLFPVDEDSAEQIREETGTDIPIIQADWFLSHGSRPPLYHDVLELPLTVDELAADLGIDIDQDVLDERVLRAGYKNAGPSKNHRVVQRHEIDGNVGAFWVSFDFANNLDDRNIFANPIDFVADGGEVIFNLDNGLQAYYVNDADGNRADKAPTNIVQDPASRDGAVENGLSCMNCHQEDGMLPKFDEIREFVLTTGVNAEETELVLGLYAERDVLEAAFEDDQNRYRTARADLGVSKVSGSTFHTLDDTHLDIMDINSVASVVGIPVKSLEDALDATPQIFPGAIVALRAEGGAIQRDEFENTIADLITALGLGQQLLVAP